MQDDSTQLAASSRQGLGRTVDLVVAGVALVLTAPLVAACCLAIVLSDGWPPIYRRRVLGKGGAEFTAFKLRTMRGAAEAWLELQPELLAEYRVHTKLAHDPRVTAIGAILRRFHLDEVPQFVNVALGQMSIVGPRMIHPSELPRFGDFAAERLAVKPGMTGLWQVTDPRPQSYEERSELDRKYLAARSVKLDLAILGRTLLTMIRRTGTR